VFIRFLQVGGIGFAVDAGLLWLLAYRLGLDPVLARAISFAATMSVTLVLNARHTFRVPLREARKSRYVLIQCMGAGINFVSYSFLVLALSAQPLVALIVGSIFASTHNYLMMRRFVF